MLIKGKKFEKRLKRKEEICGSFLKLLEDFEKPSIEIKVFENEKMLGKDTIKSGLEKSQKAWKLNDEKSKFDSIETLNLGQILLKSYSKEELYDTKLKSSLKEEVLRKLKESTFSSEEIIDDTLEVIGKILKNLDKEELK